jgi:hypothetical protein
VQQQEEPQENNNHDVVQDDDDGVPWWIRWLENGAFWESVATQTIGTLIAAGIIALVAIFAGVGYTPAIRYFVAYGLILAVGFLVFIVIGVIVQIRFIQKMAEGRRKALVQWVILVFTGVLPVIIYQLASPSVRAIVATWAGYTPK